MTNLEDRPELPLGLQGLLLSIVNKHLLPHEAEDGSNDLSQAIMNIESYLATRPSEEAAESLFDTIISCPLRPKSKSLKDKLPTIYGKLMFIQNALDKPGIYSANNDLNYFKVSIMPEYLALWIPDATKANGYMPFSDNPNVRFIHDSDFKKLDLNHLIRLRIESRFCLFCGFVDTGYNNLKKLKCSEERKLFQRNGWI